jgi:plasmid stabilization system protein ParE
MGQRKKATPASHFEITVSANARQNIREITGYIAFVQKQPMNAIRVGDAIDATMRRIATTPTAFKEVVEIPTVSKMYRRAICLSWSIIFRIKNADVLILGIIHTASRSSKLKVLRKIK